MIRDCVKDAVSEEPMLLQYRTLAALLRLWEIFHAATCETSGAAMSLDGLDDGCLRWPRWRLRWPR